MQIHFLGNPPGTARHPSEQRESDDEPKPGRRIAETPRLVEQTFDETLAASHGLVMIDLLAAWQETPATPTTVRPRIVSARAS
jgi:hypothetical protein